MRKSEERKESALPFIAGSVSGMDEKTSDLLILHYKGKMDAAEIAGILSMEEMEVDRIIRNNT